MDTSLPHMKTLKVAISYRRIMFTHSIFALVYSVCSRAALPLFRMCLLRGAVISNVSLSQQPSRVRF